METRITQVRIKKSDAVVLAGLDNPNQLDKARKANPLIKTLDNGVKLEYKPTAKSGNYILVSEDTAALKSTVEQYNLQPIDPSGAPTTINWPVTESAGEPVAV